MILKSNSVRYVKVSGILRCYQFNSADTLPVFMTVLLHVITLSYTFAVLKMGESTFNSVPTFKVILCPFYLIL